MIVPSTEICLGFVCWDTPDIRADTRTGIELSGRVEAYAGIGLDTSISSGGIFTKLDIAPTARAILPERSYTYDSFRPRVEMDWNVTSDSGFSLPSLNLNPHISLGLDFSGTLKAALPPFGQSQSPLPEIKFDLDQGLL